MASKELLLVGGPNGAGKTTFALEYVAQHPQPYLSADAIAAELSPNNPTAARIAAGRKFLQRVDQQLAGDESFVVESTLSGVTLRQVLLRARERGFHITLNFVFIRAVEASIARVAERVRKGGHDVPKIDILRRFSRCSFNFLHVYRDLVDTWSLVYNGETGFVIAASGDGLNQDIPDPQLFAAFLDTIQGERK